MPRSGSRVAAARRSARRPTGERPSQRPAGAGERLHARERRGGNIDRADRRRRRPARRHAARRRWRRSVIAAIRTLSDKPIRTIVNTHLHADHTGGNAALVKLGAGGPQRAARDGVTRTCCNRMMARRPVDGHVESSPAAALPTNTYFTPTNDFFLNGEAIVLHHMPAAHTDGDSIVLFRGSDVVSAGDLFTPDATRSSISQNGGTRQRRRSPRSTASSRSTVPAKYQEGGTYVIPGHGRLCDEADVVEYRDMVTIVRDRVAGLDQEGPDARAGEGGASRRATTTPNTGATSGFWTHRRCSSKPCTGRSMRSSVCSDSPTRAGRRCRSASRALGAAAAAGPAGGRGAPHRRDAARRGAGRLHRLLGVGRHRGLALADGDAGQRRLRRHAAQRRRPARSASVGPGEGRSRRQAVQGLRRGRHHAHAGPAAHHLAGRHAR